MIAELAPMADCDEFQNYVTFLQSLPEPQYLNQTLIMIREEVRGALTGDDPQIFLNAVDRNALLRSVLPIREMWRDEQTLLTKQKQEFFKEESRSRKQIAVWQPKRSKLAQLMQEWYKNPEEVVRDWCLDSLRHDRERFMLPSDEKEWPDVVKLPTIWAINAYRTGRIFLINRDGRRIDGNDLSDWVHYLGAIHASEFIVDDKKFRDVIEVCPPPKPRVRQFVEWAHEIIG